MALTEIDYKLIREKIIPNIKQKEFVVTLGVLAKAKEIFTDFGFKNIISIDVNDYEKPDYLIDLNNPNDKTIESWLCEKADLIINHGTLEHCFNIATAIKNMAAICKTNGYIYCHSPLNNYINHGFYQISPCFYQDFFDKNGFECEQYYTNLKDFSTFRKWDFQYNQSVGFISNNTDRFALMTVAKKISNYDIIYPMQKWCETLWKGTNK
jgi:hypothetical protein